VIKFERPPENARNAVARVERGVGVLKDDLDPPELVPVSLRQSRRKRRSVEQQLTARRLEKASDRSRER